MAKATYVLNELQKEVGIISKTLYIHNLEDWYEIPKTYLNIVPGISNTPKRFSNIETLVRAAIPNHPWDHAKFLTKSRGPSFAPQSFLHRIVRTLFPPGTTMLRNVRSGHGVVGPSGNALEIDIFLPDYKIGFEYQDLHHYFHTSYGTATLEEYKEQDQVKRALAYQKGITLIQVPFWWDWNIDSLISTIKLKRPDLLPNLQPLHPPLDENPPDHIKQKYNFDIPGLGIPMLVMSSPQSSFDPSNWWLFEKYDGVRAIWNPGLRLLYSRWGTVMQISPFVLDALPSLFWLDGEIWFGRQKGARHQASKISKGLLHLNLPWNQFKYMVFDSPSPELRNRQYATRYNFLSAHVPSGHPVVRLVPYEVCKSKDEAETMFFKVKARQGEGIILRNPDATYMHGYSHEIYKHKGYRDAEAEVVAKISDDRFLCRVHRVQQKHDIRSEGPVQEEQEERQDEEQREGEKGAHVHGADDVGLVVSQSVSNADSLISNSYITLDSSANTNNFVTVEMTVDSSAFEGQAEDVVVGAFVSFRYTAWIGNSPPLDPKIYLVRDDIQSWEHILHSKHKPLERKVWTATYSRATNDSTISLHLRKVFDDFALVKRFDPLQADNWYQVAKKDLPALLKTQRTLVQCLSTAYPEMSFNPEKFTVTYKNYWQDKENKRGFFDRFAREQGFDPLLPESWYNISSAAIMQHSKAGRAALKSYGKSLISALADVYNFVDFQVDKFVHLPQKHCHDEKNRLNSVLEVARLKGFDPLIADNWRNIKLEDFYAVKGGAGCLQWYGNSISKTLMSILPNIGLDYSYFRKPQSYWSSATNRKQFFDDFARSRNFDPLVPDNWYPFSYKDFLNFPGVDTVLMHYNRSVSGALMSLYPNVAFVVYKFHKVPANFWKEKENRRQVFEEVARVKGVQNLNDIYEWRAKVSPDDVNDLGSSLVKNYYSNSLTKALQDIFGIKFTTNS